MSALQNNKTVHQVEARAWHALAFAEREIEQVPAVNRPYQLLRIHETIVQFRQQDSSRVMRLMQDHPPTDLTNPHAAATLLDRKDRELAGALAATAKVGAELATTIAQLETATSRVGELEGEVAALRAAAESRQAANKAATDPTL